MSRRKRTRYNSATESLEQRLVLATFGTAWPDARSLSVSFPSDDAAIGAYRNSAREVFDQVTDRQEWQETALRAFQTWAVHANINVGLVADRGDHFGTVGLSTNDPRFGEFRIGAFPQPGVLASALPYQQIAGTWSGDVLLNTQTNYFLGDWKSDSPIDVPDPNEKGPAVELYSVLLHEAGNALGLEDNNIAGAVMNGIYSGPNGTLKVSDIDAIQALYGPREDIYETTNNDRRGRATLISRPTGFRPGRDVISVSGSLNNTADQDFYRFRPIRNQEKVTVRLWASGISLLKARLEVLDRDGNVLADAKADSIFENNLELEIGSLADHSVLFVRVVGNSDDAYDEVFTVGDYRIDLDYRSPELQPSIVPPSHDADADDDDDDQTVEYVSVDALFENFGLVDTEVGTNDTLATATPLETTVGFLDNTRYELQSAISSSTDRDLYRFTAPAIASPTLTINVDAVGIETPDLEIFLLNSAGDRIAAQGTRKPDGGITLIVDNPASAEEYVLFVRTREGSAVSSGNYVASINFATNTTPLTRVFAANVSTRSEDLSLFTVPKTALFRFDLTARSLSETNGAQISIYDARTGDIVATFAAPAGATRSAFVWLSAGRYYLRSTGLSQDGNTRNTRAILHAGVVSDDQGPNPVDPTQPPEYSQYPGYEWEDVPYLEPPEIIDYVDPLFEDPWMSGYFDDFYSMYYEAFLA